MHFPETYNPKRLNSKPLMTDINDKMALPYLNFQMALPEDFILVSNINNLPTTQNPLIDTAYFKSPDNDIEVLVQISFIIHEVALENYLIQTETLSGESVLEKRRINNNEDEPDRLTQKTFPDKQVWVTRRRAQKVWNGNGAFVIIINASCNKNNYEKYAELLCAIVSEFKLLKKDLYDKAERLKLVSRRYPLDFATYIPMSWKEKHHHYNTTEYLNLIFTKDIRGRTKGIMTLFCRKVTPDFYDKSHVMNTARDRLIRLGQDMDDIKTNEYSDLPGFDFVQEGFIKLTDKKNKSTNEAHFYLAQKKMTWFYAEVFGANKDSDFESWAINSRAINLLIENFKSI